jgi:histone H3/H4
MGHKSSYAEEERAPLTLEEERPRRRIVAKSAGRSQEASQSDLPMDVLIVVSKLKAYVKAKSGMNTSGDVGDELSKFVRVLVDEACENARADGRKTLMARDFSTLKIE